MSRTISNISAYTNAIPTENIKLLDMEKELSNVSKVKYNLSILYFVGLAAAMFGLFI